MYRRVYNIAAIIIRRIKEENRREERFLIDDRSYDQQAAKEILQGKLLFRAMDGGRRAAGKT